MCPGVSSRGQKPWWSAVLLGLLAHDATVSAALIPSAPSFTKRDAGGLLADLSNQFESAIPVASRTGIDLLGQTLNRKLGAPYSIPQQSSSFVAREASLATVRATFLYGPPVAGGPYYPTGPLGVAKVLQDASSINLELTPQLYSAILDLGKATLDHNKYNGLRTLDDYLLLYDDEWINSMPRGLDPGVASNYTQDLFFSMNRLSNSPYQIRRLDPAVDVLPFDIDNSTAKEITGSTLDHLFRKGRLFYADYRDQKSLPLNPGHYAAACDAYFYIDRRSGDFLPLAIRTNVGADLIYTPLDNPGDWLLAKIMFNVNDFWFGQWNHLALTHETVQIVWMATIRSISHDHPVFAVLNRLTLQVFSIQLLAKTVLFTPGNAVDLIFPFPGSAAQNYSTTQYLNGAGFFQGNYFHTDLRRRGLVKSTVGPALKHFPFYEDASVIHSAINAFMKSFVHSYYDSDEAVKADREIQAWVAEANGVAQVLDFPIRIASRDKLVDVLTQIAHLVSTAHHTVNTNELLEVSSALPFCPPSLYRPPPIRKREDTNPVDFLPPLSKALEQLTVGALFARPRLAYTNRTILHMFDDAAMLDRMNPETREANSVFMEAMWNFSADVSRRRFDRKGLSQGMPFVWRALDPKVAPYSVST